jgi:DNA-binding GntR family transcriptional regulator
LAGTHAGDGLHAIGNDGFLRRVPEPKPAPTSTLRVRDAIQHAILTGALAPGERLRAEALAQRLGTSRTPVREALQSLEAEGLVAIEPHRGAVVRPFDAAGLVELYELRAVIEPYAAARAAERIGREALAALEENCGRAEARGGADDPAVHDQIALNEEFHRLIVTAAGSRRLEVAMRSVTGIPRAFRTVFWRDDAQRTQSLFCHRELTRALRTRNAGLAEAVMRMHILGAREFLIDVIHD